MYKYEGYCHGIEHGQELDEMSWGGIYHVRICARMFEPFCSFTVSCPHRRTAWRLKSDVFDYRAAGSSGALDNPTEWYSRCQERLIGDLDLACPPPPADVPDRLSPRIRISWFPSHVTAIWEGGPYQKLSMRPPEGSPSCWYVCEYDDKVFTEQFRLEHPSIFTAPVPATMPSPNESKRSSRKSDTPTEDSKTPDEPTDDHPVTPVPSPQEAEIHCEVEAHSPDSTGSYTAKYAAPSRHSWIDNDWYSRAWDGDWNEPWRSRSGQKYDPAWADANDSSEADKTPRVPVESVTEPTPASVSIVDSAVTPSVTEIPPPVRESVTVEVTETQTQRVTVSHDGASAVTPSPLEMLGRLASQGPPLTYEDRIMRQQLANGLTIPPEVYNYLCFGEGIVHPAPPVTVPEPVTADTEPVPFRVTSHHPKKQ